MSCGCGKRISNVTARTGGAAPVQRTTSSTSPAAHQQQLEKQRRLVQAQHALNAKNRLRTVV